MKTITAWFEEQVQKFPEVEAVIFADGSITYQELDALSDHYAAQIQEFPLKTDMQIGICMERSIEQIIAMLAILKSGCAYVPLDPSQPMERIRFMLEQGNISSILIRPEEHGLFKEFKGRLIHLDKSKPSLYQTPSFKPEIKPQSLAYVIYTSGTTGNPKGVLIEHQSVTNFCSWFDGFTSGVQKDRIDCSGNYIFDMTVSTSIVTLMLGKTMVLCSDEVKKAPLAYLHYLAAKKVNLIKITPSYLKELLRDIEKESIALPFLRSLVFGGERLLTADCEAWLKHYPQHVLFNEYGPTETTVAVTHQKIEASNIQSFPTYVPIGKPGPGMFCYILNENNELVDKEAGELHIGGICLARGYLKQEKLSAEKFIAMPKALKGHNKACKRLYKTGDLCRYLPDGSIEFMGRIDRQIKIRGFRIEPGEIEIHLRTHPAIQDALVLLHEDEQKNARLLAYCIFRDKNLQPSYTELRKHLQLQLAAYMVPNNFIAIDEIPLTQNGKLDQNALPSPSYLGREAYLAPRNALEKKLATLWAKELALPFVGVKDNFFELGGHSLHAARIVSDIRDSFKKKISMQEFYQAESINKLAILIASRPKICADTKPMQRTLSQKNLPLSDFQLLLWFLNTFDKKVKKLNLVSRKRFSGSMDMAALQSAFQALVLTQDSLSLQMKIFSPAQYCKNAPHFGMSTCSLQNGSWSSIEKTLTDSVDQLMRFSAWSRVNPKLMVRLFFLPDKKIEIQVCLPHVFSDEDSLNVLWRQVEKYYHAALANKLENCVKNDKKTKAFYEHIVEEQKIIHDHFEEDTIFWEQYSKGCCAFRFPDKYIEKNMLAKQVPYSSYQSLSLDLLRRLEHLSLHHQLALNMLLYAAVVRALKKLVPWACADVSRIVHLVKSTRNSAAWDETMGCFLRIDPLKIDAFEDIALLSLAKNVQKDMLEQNHRMQASSLLKLAAQSPKNTSMCGSIINFALRTYQKTLKSCALDYKALSLMSKLYRLNKDKDFIVCVNVQNSLSSIFQEKRRSSWQGLQEENIKMFPTDLENFDNVCDISFLVDHNSHTPYVVVSANLKPEFRKRIAKAIIEELMVFIQEDRAIDVR